jgi:hypothetical protein
MQQDMEALRGPCDGGFWEASDLEKAASKGGIARGVEGGRGFGFVGRDGGAGIKVCAGADGDLDVVKGALGFDHAAPVEGRAGFGEGGDFAGKFAAVGAGLQSGDGAAVKNNTDSDIENYRSERQRGAKPAARAFAASADFFGDEAGEEGEKNSGQENYENPEVERGEPVESEAAGQEGPEELDAGGLAKVEGEMKEGGGEGGDEDRGAWDWIFGGFGFEEEEGKSGEKREDESGGERVKIGAIKSEVGGRAEVGAEEVGVGDDTTDDDRDCGGTREAREGGALKSVRGQCVREGIHG